MSCSVPSAAGTASQKASSLLLPEMAAAAAMRAVKLHARVGLWLRLVFSRQGSRQSALVHCRASPWVCNMTPS